MLILEAIRDLSYSKKLLEMAEKKGCDSNTSSYLEAFYRKAFGCILRECAELFHQI